MKTTRPQPFSSLSSDLPWQALLRRLADNVPRGPAARESWMFRALVPKPPFAARQALP